MNRERRLVAAEPLRRENTGRDKQHQGDRLGNLERRLGLRRSRGLQCWNLVSGVSAAFITKLLGRRTQYLIAFGGMTIVFACWTGASAVFAQDANNNRAAGAVVGMIFIYYGFYNLMHPLTYIYLTEVFPFISPSAGLNK